MSRRQRPKEMDENMKELLMNFYRGIHDSEVEALEAFNKHVDDASGADKVYFHGFLKESEFSKEDFMMLPKPILSLISWLVRESEENHTFQENVDAWLEDRPF